MGTYLSNEAELLHVGFDSRKLVCQNITETTGKKNGHTELENIFKCRHYLGYSSSSFLQNFYFKIITKLRDTNVSFSMIHQSEQYRPPSNQ